MFRVAVSLGLHAEANAALQVGRVSQRSDSTQQERAVVLTLLLVECRVRLSREEHRAAKRQCAQCGVRSEAKLKACVRCCHVRYCSKECQTADWKGSHREKCAELALAHCSRPRLARRLPLKVWRRILALHFFSVPSPC